MKDKNNKNIHLREIGYVSFIIGILLIIVAIISGLSSFSLNVDVIKTPLIFKYQENQGREYQEFYKEYSVFVNEIDSLNLDELNGKDFENERDYYIYSNYNYNYLAESNYIKVIKDKIDVYSNTIEDDFQIVTLYSDKVYELEISSSLITFSVNDVVYKFNIFEDGYKMEVNYSIGTYNIYEELYDMDFNFKGIKAEYDGFTYEGYLVKNIEGYSLSEDKSMICKDGTEECELSTKYLENSEIIYYTIVEYYFDSVVKENMLLVKAGEVFPFS